MKLTTLHQVLITTGIVFCAGFGLRALLMDEPGLGGFFVLSAVILTGYLIWFFRKIRPL